MTFGLPALRPGTATWAALCLTLATLPHPSAAEAAEKVSPLAFRKLVQSARRSVVPVVSKPSGTAVVIGVRGQLLAPHDLVRDDKLQVEYAGQKLEAKLIERAPDLGVALLALPEADYPAATAGSAARLSGGNFLLALAFQPGGRLKTGRTRLERPGKSASGGPVLRARVNAGEVLFNARGELVALSMPRRKALVSIDEVRRRFAGGETK